MKQTGLLLVVHNELPLSAVRTDSITCPLILCTQSERGEREGGARQGHERASETAGRGQAECVAREREHNSPTGNAKPVIEDKYQYPGEPSSSVFHFLARDCSALSIRSATFENCFALSWSVSRVHICQDAIGES